MKPLKGASPVPGPTMITGHVERYGNLRVDFLTYIGTTGALSPVILYTVYKCTYFIMFGKHKYFCESNGYVHN